MSVIIAFQRVASNYALYGMVVKFDSMSFCLLPGMTVQGEKNEVGFLILSLFCRGAVPSEPLRIQHSM